MRNINGLIRSLCALAAIGLSCCAIGQTTAPSSPQYAVTGTLNVGGAGGWDYVTIDAATHLVYVTRSTHTQVIDPQTGKVVADIPGGKRVHGVALVPAVGRGFISDGESGEVLVFDMKTNKVVGKIAAADDADGIIYDLGSDRVLVSCGDANTLLVLDPHADISKASPISVPLGGKPEFLAADGHGHAFVCLNDKNEIAVVDLKGFKVVDRWSCGSGKRPTGIAIDGSRHQLFVGCRNKQLIVMDDETGKVLHELPIGQGNDACVFDPETRTAFASCGDSTLYAIKESTANGELSGVVKTTPGARTVGIDTSTHMLYLPTADFRRSDEKSKPSPVPDSFKVLVVEPSK